MAFESLKSAVKNSALWVFTAFYSAPDISQTQSLVLRGEHDGGIKTGSLITAVKMSPCPLEVQSRGRRFVLQVDRVVNVLMIMIMSSAL